MGSGLKWSNSWFVTFPSSDRETNASFGFLGVDFLSVGNTFHTAIINGCELSGL